MASWSRRAVKTYYKTRRKVKRRNGETGERKGGFVSPRMHHHSNTGDHQDSSIPGDFLKKKESSYNESDDMETKLLSSGTEIWQPINDHDKEVTTSACASATHTYKKRWYVLGVFSLLTLISNDFWNTWGPIARPCKLVFGWSNTLLLVVTSWGAIAPLLGAPVAIWLVQTKGLKVAVIWASFLQILGKALQAIALQLATNKMLFNSLISVGQFLSMFPANVPNAGPPIIAAMWFPANERAFATAVSVTAIFAGVAVSFITGPAIVEDVCPINVTIVGSHRKVLNECSINESSIHMVHRQIGDYMYGQLFIGTLLFLCLILYFPNKPPLPPSISKIENPLSHFQGLRVLFRKKSFWAIVVISITSGGIYAGWISSLAEAVSPFGIDEKTASWLGFWTQIAAIVSGLLAGRLADIFQHHIERILLVLFSGATIAQVLFTITCQSTLPFSKPLLYTYVICCGLFLNATAPLMFQIMMETSYPVNEAISSGIYTALFNVLTLLFYIPFMFPHVDFLWMNWLAVAGCSCGIPFFLFFRVSYTRLNIDSLVTLS